jgi:hypothetical protein
MNLNKVYDLLLEVDAIRGQGKLDRQSTLNSSQNSNDQMAREIERVKQATDFLGKKGLNSNDAPTAHALSDLRSGIMRIGDGYLNLADEIAGLLGEPT